ncbi:MAG: LSM domain-containing protein, partial [Candidatus Micrarchaeia archaeon]
MAQERPFDLLNKAIGQQILVRLKNNTEIRGRVTSFDVHMNIVLENAEELEDGNL